MSEFEQDLMKLVNEGFRFKGSNLHCKLKGISNRLIDEPELPTKAYNWARRKEIKTIGEFIENITAFANSRGIGEKTLKDTKNKILQFAYEKMNQTNRQEFWKSILE